MLTKEKNERLCRTGKGTPGGEFLRRYWQPVALSSELKTGEQPTAVRIMGEDLVLFRDDAGRPGLLGRHCSHRLTSLAYGRVEDGGIRCPFHGWLYDVGGRCLEQPAEPDDGMMKDRIRHLAYPLQELGGLVFAYMGPPELMPELPRYEPLVRSDGTRQVSSYPVKSNYVQHLEGAVDTVHAVYLHTDHWSTSKKMLAKMPKPKTQVQETDFGTAKRTWLPNVSSGNIDILHSFFFMPAGFVRVHQPLPEVEGEWPGGIEDSPEAFRAAHKFYSWYVPIDDEHTIRFMANFAPTLPGTKPYQWREVSFEGEWPGPENDYFRDYLHNDTTSGIAVNAPGGAVKGFLAQDGMVNETQGAIVDRSQEHLGASDAVLAAMRRMMLESIDAVEAGRDPKHIVRETRETIEFRPADAAQAITA